MGSPFIILFLKSYFTIKKIYGIDLWTNFGNMNKVALGRPIEGLNDPESQILLKKARIGLIGWNIIAIPGAAVFMYYIFSAFR